MIFNTKKPKPIVIDGVTFTCHRPDAWEQSQLVDSLVENRSDSTAHIIPIAKTFFEIAVDAVEGLVDDEGAPVSFEKVDGAVSIDFVKGFSLGVLRQLVDEVIIISEPSDRVKKK